MPLTTQPMTPPSPLIEKPDDTAAVPTTPPSLLMVKPDDLDTDIGMESDEKLHEMLHEMLDPDRNHKRGASVLNDPVAPSPPQALTQAKVPSLPVMEPVERPQRLRSETSRFNKQALRPQPPCVGIPTKAMPPHPSAKVHSAEIAELQQRFETLREPLLVAKAKSLTRRADASTGASSSGSAMVPRPPAGPPPVDLLANRVSLNALEMWIQDNMPTMSCKNQHNIRKLFEVSCFDPLADVRSGGIDLVATKMGLMYRVRLADDRNWQHSDIFDASESACMLRGGYKTTSVGVGMIFIGRRVPDAKVVCQLTYHDNDFEALVAAVEKADKGKGASVLTEISARSTWKPVDDPNEEDFLFANGVVIHNRTYKRWCVPAPLVSIVAFWFPCTGYCLDDMPGCETDF